MTISERSLTAWSDGGTYSGEEAGIIARCLAGEEPAFVALYDRHAAYVYRLCFSLLQHREDAEEALQDTFEYAFRKLAKYDPDRASFKTWLYQIAVSRSRNKRRRKRLPTFPLAWLGGEPVSDEAAPAPEEVMAHDGRQKRIWRALSQLSPKLRETAVLRYYEGFIRRSAASCRSRPRRPSLECDWPTRR
jgi:RNA polymerase sigma-70 factor (ECF subfamily)